MTDRKDRPSPEKPNGNGPECEDFTRPLRVTLRSLGPLFFWAALFVILLKFHEPIEWVVLSFIGAVVLAATLSPLAEHMPGPTELRGVLAVLVAVAVVAGLVTLLVWALAGPIKTNLVSWPELQKQMDQLLASLSLTVGLEKPLTLQRIAHELGRAFTGSSVANVVQAVLDTLLGVGITLLLIIVGAMYMLHTPRDRLASPALSLLPESRREPSRRAMSRLASQLRWWALGAMFSMVCTGIITGVGFWIIGLQFALPLALMSGIAEIVPTFGPLTTLILGLLVGATQGPSQMLGVVVVYVIVQTVESYVLTPLVMKGAVSVPPVVTLFTVLLWGNIFGLPGLILAIPIDLILWAFLKQHIILPRERAEQEMNTS